MSETDAVVRVIPTCTLRKVSVNYEPIDATQSTIQAFSIKGLSLSYAVVFGSKSPSFGSDTERKKRDDANTTGFVSGYVRDKFVNTYGKELDAWPHRG